MNNELPSYDHRPGSGPALVLLHYWGGSSQTWRPLADELAGREIVQVDFRGWGRSAHLTGPGSIEQHAADVSAIIDAEALDDYVLVGHSMGGKVAQLVASRRPEGLRGVVLVAPAPARKSAHITSGFQEQLSHAYDDEKSIVAARDEILTGTRLSPELGAQVLADSSSAASDEIRVEWPMHGISTDITEQTQLIEVPTLVVAGERDGVEPEETLRADLLPYLEHARLVTVPGSGHLIPIEAPVELAELIRAFPSSTDSPWELSSSTTAA